MTPADHDPAAGAELAQLGTATVYEAYGREGLLDIDLEQIIPGTRVAGPARIAACAQDDNWAVHKVMSLLRPGEILVLTMIHGLREREAAAADGLG